MIKKIYPLHSYVIKEYCTVAYRGFIQKALGTPLFCQFTDIAAQPDDIVRITGLQIPLIYVELARNRPMRANLF